MEALSFMKFWRPNGRARREIKIPDVVNGFSAAFDDPKVEIAEGDDSLFELELSLFDFYLNDKKTLKESTNPDRIETKTTPCSVSSTDHFSKNKVIPVEIGPKPHSPIALLKSSPKFRAFSFKKPKSVESEKSTPEKKESGKSLDANETSFRKTTRIARPRHGDDTVSRRILSMIKPLYGMTAKRQGTKENGVEVAPSPAMEKQRSNAAAGIRTVRRHLGKSRSASTAVGAMSPANRVDESLQIQQDWIQGAILHCKKSFHGSRESSQLLRSTSDPPSQEKLSSSSSEDSYIFSRTASDSMSEKSIDSQTINVP
ncbi:PREDICTED: probable membrane-associated kinase regulator 5 [Tarenaya hassleriana]|uniref:probable membrane-associated kinase regulator 5 n=1 Tax=Tarenaya hassleriana TaxID=28532 RepID=UPI00053C985B|nr:PREDICTED: probable membrane-associated kinase regulator 5 [Tarenaya hassleriana]